MATNCCDDLDNNIPTGLPGATGATGATGPQGPSGQAISVAKIFIPSAQVLTLNTTPVAVIAAPGAGNYIKVLGVDGRISNAGSVTAYTTHTQLNLVYSGAPSVKISYDTNILALSAVGQNAFSNLSAGYAISTNAAVNVMADAGNPAAGNSDLWLYVYYQIQAI